MNSQLLLGLYALVFPYIFLLFDCLEMALIDHIVKCKVHSVLWQLVVGGGVNLKIYPGKSVNELSTLIRSLCTGISLYIPII